MTEPRRGLTRLGMVGMLWTALSMSGLAVAETVALVVLARLLTPDDFGLYAAALVIVKFSVIFQNLGVAPAIVQRPQLEERHVRVGFTLSLVLSVAIGALIWGTAPLIAHALRLPGLSPIVRATSLIFLFLGASTVALAVAQRALRFRWLAALDAATFAVGFVLAGPILALLGFGVWALVGALIVQHLVRMVVLLIGQPHPKRLTLDRATMGELLYYGGGFTIARIFNYLASQVDKLVVGRWLGADALGIYALASQLMTAPSVIVGQILDRVLFPTMALVQAEPARLARAFRRSIAGCALLVLPASVVVAILVPELVQVLLGPAWARVVGPFQILAFGMLFRTSYKLSDSLVRATGAVYARAWRQAAFVSAVAMGSWIGQHWGVDGVAYGAVAAVAINFLLMAQLSLRLTGVSWPEFALAHVPGLALAVTIGMGAWALAEQLRALHFSPFALLIDVALASGAAGLLLCWLLPNLFLGPDGQSALRVLASLKPAWIRRRAG